MTNGFTPRQGADFDRWLTHNPADDLIDCPVCNGLDYECDLCGGDGLVDPVTVRRFYGGEAGHERANAEAQEYRGVTCPICHGKGNASHTDCHDPCSECGGSGRQGGE